MIRSLITKKGGNDGADLRFLYENFNLVFKLVKSMAGPKIQQYLDPLEDVVYLFKELRNKAVKPDVKKLLPRILKVLQAYQELVAPYIKSVRDTLSQDDSFDFSSLVNIAGSFISQMNGNQGGGGGSSFVDYLPMIVNTISAFTGNFPFRVVT